MPPIIRVHPLTNDPTAAWKEISKTQKMIKLNVTIPSTPVGPDKVRFVCMSDTHSLIRNLNFDVPDGDVFIHAGDFTKCGQKEEVIEFNNWLGTLPHKYKIVIAGNHELSLDTKFRERFKRKLAATKQNVPDVLSEEVPNYGNTKDNISDAVSIENMHKYLDNCTYLQDSGIEIYGIKLWGSPWQPEFGNWAFNLQRGEQCLSKWDLIPSDTEVLITHTPPLGHGDLACSGVRAGCVELLSSVQKRIKPNYHIFGHIHEGYGVTSDCEIVYINASTCDINYIPKNLPVVFDIRLRRGFVKS